MEKGFDFGALMRKNEKKHKGKPTHFVSVAGGVQKRLQTNLKYRRSSRLTIFDKIRNLPKCDSPDPVSEAQLKVEHRRLQLEKWKAEKEQKKKEAAALKKKPFVAGVPHVPLKFVFPPPLPKPSSSGRVTRSQTLKNNTSKCKNSPKQKGVQSFAPKNASFKPPEIKNLTKLPALAPPSKPKKKVNNAIVFEPILPKPVKPTRSKTVINRQNAIETKMYVRKPVENRSIPLVKGKVGNKAIPNTSRVTKKFQSSSSSDINPGIQSSSSSDINPSIQSSSSSDIDPTTYIVKRIKTPGAGKSTKVLQNLTAKALSLSSDEQSSSEKPATKQSRKSVMRKSVTSLLSSDSSNPPSSVEEKPITMTKNRKSVPANFSPIIILDSLENSIDESYKTPNKSKCIPKSESGSEEKLRSPKSPVELPLTPEQIETAKKISPCVTLSRGKDNARKEMRWKIDEGMLDDDTSDIENVEHFRRQLASEIKRMTEMCDTWDKVSQHTELPEPVQEAVLAAVGQARLLMSQKMQQFASLVERCARPDPNIALVTPADLHGFWDMVFMQVENVDLRFKKLEELRACNWIEDKPVEVKRKVAKPLAARRAKPAANSRIRDMIAAARKAKKDQESSSSNSSSSPISASSSTSSTKTFEAGFFSVQSPVKSPKERTPSTPGGASLLKAVLSSEASKASASRKSASFAMLRASVLGKNLDYEGIAPLQLTPQVPPINLNATPGRSILKSANVTSSKTPKKSMKLVFFDDSDSDVNNSFEHAKKNHTDTKSPIEGTDSGVSSMDVDKHQEKSGKENKPKAKLVRQDAVEGSVMTRSRRKSMQTLYPEDTPKEKAPNKASRKKCEGETNTLNAGVTPKRSRKKKSLQPTDTEMQEKTPKRSTRKKPLKEVESNVMEETKPASKRSNRLRKSAPVDLMT